MSHVLLLSGWQYITVYRVLYHCKTSAKMKYILSGIWFMWHHSHNSVSVVVADGLWPFRVLGHLQPSWWRRPIGTFTSVRVAQLDARLMSMSMHFWGTLTFGCPFGTIHPERTILKSQNGVGFHGNRSFVFRSSEDECCPRTRWSGVTLWQRCPIHTTQLGVTRGWDEKPIDFSIVVEISRYCRSPFTV